MVEFNVGDQVEVYGNIIGTIIKRSDRLYYYDIYIVFSNNSSNMWTISKLTQTFNIKLYKRKIKRNHLPNWMK